MYLRYGDASWDRPEPARPPLEGTRIEPRAGAASPPRAGHLPVVNLTGVRLHAITEQATIAHILAELDAGRGGMVVTPNLDHLRRCRKDAAFAHLVAHADLVVADGMPLVWASRVQGTRLPERVAGSNLISSLSRGAAERGRSIFLLGGAPGTADAAARVLCERFPGLRIAGTFCPPPGFEADQKKLAEIEQALRDAQPDIVYVALGSPKQEFLIAQMHDLLPKAWWLGVGISLSFLCGHVRRAPRWMQRTGIEWAHRLFQEPRRLFKRYVIQGLPFAARLFGGAMLHGTANRLWRRRRLAAQQAAFAARAADAPRNGSTNGNGRRYNGNGNGAANGNGHAVVAAARIDAGGSQPLLSPDDSMLGLSLDEIARTNPRSSSHDAAPRLSRLRALILLGGSVRPSPLCASTGRSVLDLPLNEQGSLLNHWLDQAQQVAASAGLEKLPVRVMVSQNSPEPSSALGRYFNAFRVERDQSEYRGTGGVLRDVAAGYADDDLLLVANAAQVLVDPLAKVTAALDRLGGEVSLVSHEDGTPSGVMLLTCKALRQVAETGFIDMKEQALPQIAGKFEVRVLRRHRPTGLPVRTREDYIDALRMHHRQAHGQPVVADPLAEDWAATFSLVEPGAMVDSTARVHDSVVLSGAVVEPGAVLVRTVVCPGAVVKRDRTAVDECLEPTGRDRTRQAAQAALAASSARMD